MNEKSITNHCDMMGIRAIMVDLPYPPTKVKEKNYNYANILSIDYSGMVSEMSAISQYINNENRLFCQNCPMAKTILGIAMAEMMHLQKLGELIFLLGGTVNYVAKYPNGRQQMWTPKYLQLTDYPKEMLLNAIEAEKATIHQYKMHIEKIDDIYIQAVLKRIILDEEYHIMIFQELLAELK